MRVLKRRHIIRVDAVSFEWQSLWTISGVVIKSQTRVASSSAGRCKSHIENAGPGRSHRCSRTSVLEKSEGVWVVTTDNHTVDIKRFATCVLHGNSLCGTCSSGYLITEIEVVG